MAWTDWIGRKVFLRTKQGKVYTGKVVNYIELDEDHSFLEILDKFRKFVGISVYEIIEIKEEDGDELR